MCTFISSFFLGFVSVKSFPEASILLLLRGALYGRLHDFPTCFLRTESVDLKVGFASPNFLGEDSFRT